MENTLGKKSNLTDVERNKKIILRFFQDVRLLWLWKQYIVEKHISPIVFKKRYVADVLGSLSFTAFAEKTMNKKANSSIFVIFLYYLECMEFKNVPIYHDLNDIEIELTYSPH